MSQLQLADAAKFDEIYRLLQSSFPDDEYRPYDAQKEVFSDPRYHVYILPGENDTIRAMITIWQFDDFAFIEHFAVSPKCRNQGLGAQILQEVLQVLSCPVCLEVELPQTELARRRIAFYTRNGFFLNDYPYTQPPYSKEKHPIDLLVMTSGGKISPERFETIRQTLWDAVYHVC